MTELPLFDKDGKRLGAVTIDETVFGDKVRTRLLRQVVLAYEANRRQGTASSKTRGEVAGSTRKPWPQKHTGMARAGTRRSPIWRKGGVVFGPRPRDYRQEMTAGMRRAALDSAIRAKIRDGEVCVVERIEMEPPKTRKMAALLRAMGLERTVLIGLSARDEKVWRASRNLPGVTVEPVAGLTAHSVLRHQKLVLAREALDAMVAARRKPAEAAAKA